MVVSCSRSGNRPVRVFGSVHREAHRYSREAGLHGGKSKKLYLLNEAEVLFYLLLQGGTPYTPFMWYYWKNVVAYLGGALKHYTV